MGKDRDKELTILDADFWRERLIEAEARGQTHRAVFHCLPKYWQQIEAKHRRLLAEYIKEGDEILDCGCGWGRLINLLPTDRKWYYTGVDLSPDFIQKAYTDHTEALEKGANYSFLQEDLRNLENVFEFKVKEFGKFKIAVLVSIRPMMKRHLGDEEWTKMEKAIRGVADKLLYLEYDPDDNGTMEVC